MKINMRILLAGLLLLVNHSLQAEPDTCNQAAAITFKGPCSDEHPQLKMNDLQAVGSHNSYKLAIPDPELALIATYNEQSARSLDYSHLSLTTQLELGMRQIELDIFYDPEGGRYADPLLPRQAARSYGALPYDDSEMHATGFKVLHAQDIDVRSNCATWIRCLQEIKVWSDANPTHVPILIMFNAKEGGSAYPGVQAALEFTGQAYRDLDAETLSVFPADRIIKPDDVRGNHASLREAVLAGNWPTLDRARGKVFFALDEGPEKVLRYMDGRQSLQGLPLFVNSIDESQDHAAYFTINNPVEDQERIKMAVQAGFIVRTRADANTVEARINATERRDAAFRSGAHYISTDYYVPRLEFSDYSVSLPGADTVRCNPIRRGSACAIKE
jgi:hypothetical protein